MAIAVTNKEPSLNILQYGNAEWKPDSFFLPSDISNLLPKNFMMEREVKPIPQLLGDINTDTEKIKITKKKAKKKEKSQ